MLQAVIVGLIIALAVLGFLVGLAKGPIRAGARLAIVIICLIIGVSSAKGVAAQILTMEIDDGNTIKDLISNLIIKQNEAYASLVDLVYPIVAIIVQVAVGIVCVIGALLVSWFFTLIVDIVLKIVLRPLLKKLKGFKWRLIGGGVGVVTGLVAAFTLASVVTGFASNASKVLSMRLDKQSIAEMSNIDDATLDSLGLKNFDDSAAAKVGKTFHPFVYNNLSTIELDGKKYTLDGQLGALKKAADLASTFTNFSDIDFENTEDLKNITNALRELDFNDLSPEEESTIQEMMDTALEAFDVDVDINVADLKGVNFGAVADAVDLVGTIQNGGEVKTEDVAGALKGFVTNNGEGKNTLDVINEFGADLSGFAEGQAGETIEAALNSLEGDSSIAPEDLASLYLLFGLQQ